MEITVAAITIIAAIIGTIVGLFQLWEYLTKRKQQLSPSESKSLLAADGSTFLAAQKSRIESRYRNSLYHFGTHSALSVRIVGAADEYFPCEVVHIIPNNTPYQLPSDFIAIRDKILSELKENAEKKGEIFFDGPNTRLIDFRVNIHDESEQKHLELTLGPIGWYDYSQ